MTAEIAKFPGDTTNAREHVTFAIADLAIEFAKAWEVGYRVALNDVRMDPISKTTLLSAQHGAYETRVNLYEAIIRAQLQHMR